MKLMSCIKLASLIILNAQLCALAVDSTWTNTAGGNWSDPTRWNNGVPGPTTNAFLTNNAATSYTATNDVLNNTISNLTVLNLGAGINTLLMNTSGFTAEGNAIIGRNGVLNLNGFDATIDGTMVISNLGRAVITNGSSLQVGSSASGLLASTGTLFVGTSGMIAAGVISNTGFILTTGGGVITGSVANLRTGGASYGSAGINVGGADGDGALSLVGSQPFLNGVNNGSIVINSNGTLNVGGIDAASSTATFTNRGAITMLQGSLTGNRTLRLNAGILVNDTNGSITMTHSPVTDNGLTNYVNADVLNFGSITLNSAGALRRVLRSVTNYGTFDIANLASQFTIIQEGSFLNQGTVLNGSQDDTILIRSGQYINGINGTSTFQRTTLRAFGMVQDGTMIVLNNGIASSFFETNGTTRLSITNNGTLRWGAVNGTAATMLLGTLYNEGAFEVLGLPSVTINSPQSAVSRLDGSLVNALGGIMTVGTNAIFATDNSSVNQGTIQLSTNSVFSAGRSTTGHGASGFFIGGQLNWTNAGMVNLVEGSYLAVRFLTNGPSAALTGAGNVGAVTVTNLIAGGVSNFVKHLTVADVANAGTIAPDGTLNVGAITNLSGASIIGKGVIQSLNITNYVDGLSVVTSNINTGARIHNESSGTILASGGLLVLSNGFLNNTQFGTFGATNGGTIQLGDGTLALTNNGTISIFGSEINVGDLRNNGTIEITDSVVTWSNLVVNAGRYISDPSTNIFLDHVTVEASGTLEGGVGDLFDFKGNLIINSTNTSLFDLASSTVSFSGGVDHTNGVTGLDFGKFLVGLTPSNFAYGTLDLSSLDNLYLIDGDGDGSNTNALYVNILDLGGTTNNVSLLHSEFNIYYNPEVLANGYLNEQTFSLVGGGSLIPLVPEPSTFILLLAGGAVLMRRRRS